MSKKKLGRWFRRVMAHAIAVAVVLPSIAGFGLTLPSSPVRAEEDGAGLFGVLSADPSAVNPGSGGDWANRIDVTFNEDTLNRVDENHPEYDGITIDPSIWSGDGGMEDAAEVTPDKWAYQAGLKKHQDGGRALDLLFMKLDPMFLNNPALSTSDVKVTVNYYDSAPNPEYTDWDGNAFAVAYKSDFDGPYHPGNSNPDHAALAGSNTWMNHEVVIPAGDLFYQYPDHVGGFWSGYYMSGDGWCMALHATQPVYIHSITLEILGDEIPSDPLAALRSTYNQYKDIQKGNYTDTSWGVFAGALAAAKSLIDGNSADETVNNGARTALVNAYNGLQENTPPPAGDYSERVGLTFAPGFPPGSFWGGAEVWDQENAAGFGGIAVSPQMYGKNGDSNNESPVYDTIDGKYAFEAGRRDAVRDGNQPYTMTAMRFHSDFKNSVVLGENSLTIRVTYYDGATGSTAGTGQGFYLRWDEGQGDVQNKRVSIGDSNTWKTEEFTVTPSGFGQAGWGYDTILFAEDPVWIHSVVVEKAGASLPAKERLQREFDKCSSAWDNGNGGDIYSAASWNNFNTAMSSAQNLLTSGPSDEDDTSYAAAREDLAAAYSALARSAKTLLSDSVAEFSAKYDSGAGNNDAMYSDASWADFASAMADAMVLLAGGTDKDDQQFVTARTTLVAAGNNLVRVRTIEGYVRYDVSDEDGVTLTYGDGLSPNTALGTGFEDTNALVTTGGGAWGGAHLRVYLDERFPRGEINSYVISIEYYSGLSMDGALGLAYRGGGWSSYLSVTSGAWRTLNLTTDLNPDPADNGYIGTMEIKAFPFQIRAITVKMLFEGDDPPPDDPRSAKEKLADQYSEYLPRLNAGNLDGIWTIDTWLTFSAAMTGAATLINDNTIGDDDPQYDSVRSALVAAYGAMKRSNPLTEGSITYVNNGGTIEEERNGVWLDFNRSESPNSDLGVGDSGKGALITSANGGSLGNTHIAVMLDSDFHTGKKENFLVKVEYFTGATQSDAIGIAHRGGWSAYGPTVTGKWSTTYILVEQVSWPEDEHVFLIELKVAPVQIHSVTVQLLSGETEPEQPEYFGDNQNPSWADEVKLYWDNNGIMQREGVAYSDYSNVVKYVPVEMNSGEWGAKTIPMGGVTGSESGSLSYAMFLNVAPIFRESDPPVVEVEVEFWNAPRSTRTPLGGTGYGPDDRKFGFYIGFVNKDKIGMGIPDQYPFGTSIVATGTEEWRTETIRLENINLGQQHMGSAYGDYYRYNMALYIQEGMIIRSITIKKPKEVVLAPEKDDANLKPYLFYSNENIALPVALTNGTGAPEAAASVEVALYNYDNILVTKTSASTALAAGEKLTVVPTFAAGSVPKGSYFVEFTAMDTEGNTYSTVRDFLTVVQGLEDLAESGVISIDSFGVATHFLWYGNDDPKNDHEMMVAIEVMRAAGITTVRDEYTWFEVESGNMNQDYSFTHDRWLSLMIQNGITPVLCLNYGHDYWGWDPVNGTETSGKHGMKFEQFPKAGYPLANNPYLSDKPELAGKTYIEACGDYAYALVSHLANSDDPYLRQVKYFEIWNEPNLHTGADVFFPVQKLLYERAKDANPNAVVMAAAVCMFDEAFIWRLMDLGGYEYMDSFSYHYPDHPRGRIITSTVTIQEYVKKISKQQMPEKYPDGKDLTVWITELGDSSYRISNTLLAAQYAQYYVEHRAYFNEGLNESVYLYVLQNYTTLDAVTHQVQSHGLTYNEGPYAPKPMIASLNAAAWLTRATLPGERYDGLRFKDRDGNPVRSDLESPALVEGKPVRVYTFYATAESVGTNHAARNVGDQIIALYSYDGTVPVSIYVGENFTLYDGYGNVVNAQAMNGVLALTLTEMPQYIILPAANALNPVVLGEGLFTTATGVRSVTAGSIMEITVSRTGQAQSLSGFYTAGLVNGWTLVDADGDPIEKQAFGPGASDVVRVKLPGNAEVGKNSKVFIYAEDSQGSSCAEMIVECNVLTPVSMEAYPVKRDDGTLEIEVKITNNRNTILPSGTMTVIQPADAGVLTYDAIPAGGSAVMSFADSRLKKDEMVPFTATVTVDGIEESISRNFSGLSAVAVEGVDYDASAKYKPDWDSIDWSAAETFGPDYDNYVNKKDGGIPPRTWGGTDDLDFTGSTMFDNRYLYIKMEITDDDHILTGDVNNSWAQDSLQISIDPLRGYGSARDQYGIPQAAGFRGEISIIAALFPATGHYGMAIQYNTVPGLDARNLQESHIYAVRDENTHTTTYMLALDWGDILTAEQLAGGFNPANTHLGFAVTVNDIDQGTSRGWMNYMDGIAYGKDVRKFGDLILAGATEEENPKDVPLTGFALNKSTLVLNQFKTATFTPSAFLPENTTSALVPEWSTSNPAVVTLTGNGGQIKGVAPGTATISCTIDGVVVSCVVTVVSVTVPVESFTLQKTELSMAQYKTVTLSPINISPATATNLDGAKWFTSNSEIVSFTGNGGQVKALKRGTAVITCQIGAVKAYCKITVT